MARYHTHKQAVLIAAMVIFLCLVLLVGSTLALFTSDINDGTIGVNATSGKIDVDIVDEEGNSLKGEVLQFQTTKEQQEVLFEPGATFFTQGFKIKNNGDIRINFLVTVTDDDKLDMKKFYEAFEVWISTTRDKNGAKLLTEFRGELEEGDKGGLAAGAVSEKTYYLFVKMKETAGNEFQGYSYEGIGITVHAVQGNVSIDEGVTE